MQLGRGRAAGQRLADRQTCLSSSSSRIAAPVLLTRRLQQQQRLQCAAAARNATTTSCSRARQQQPLLVQAKFSNPFDGMFGGNKGGDPDAARRAIEVRWVVGVPRTPCLCTQKQHRKAIWLLPEGNSSGSPTSIIICTE